MNNGSAFIEVLVSNTDSDCSDYQVGVFRYRFIILIIFRFIPQFTKVLRVN